MGQQQLLLVILVTIIVGIATVVAINTFSSASDQANQDAARNDLTQVASAAHSYYMKPEMLGGGGNAFTGITFNDITFPADTVYNSSLTAENANGTYVISGVTADEFTVTATLNNDGTIAATVVPNSIQIGDYSAPAE
jgi:Tfp pilus assembly protein PilE